MKRRDLLAAAGVLLVSALAAAAQTTGKKAEDPITGHWGTDGVTLLELQFDGEKTVTGTVIWRHGSAEQRSPIGSGSFDPKTGALKLEGETKRPDNGAVAKYLIEGTLENGTLSGTFKVDADNGQFTFTRISAQVGVQ